MKERIREILRRTLACAQSHGLLPPGDALSGEAPPFEVEKPKVKAHGEFSTNLAFVLKGPPHENAQKLISSLDDSDGIVERVEVAGGGFINFVLKRSAWQESLREIVGQGQEFGRVPSLGQGRRVLIEFVSANPTGPLHIGNARGGPIGDVLASLFEATGHEVVREYYLNDVGGQIDELGKAVSREIRILRGEKAIEEEGTYRGAYLADLAREAKATDEGALGAFAIDRLTREIERDCEGMGIRFDSWARESDFLAQGRTDDLMRELADRGVTRKKEGAIWFASDDESSTDRESVLVRSDGRPTYFANDIAYHRQKYARGFDRIVNIWGSNHHGHVPRIRAAMKALGLEPKRLQVVLYQFVRVKRGADVVSMSKRAGNYVTAREVLDEVGRDALRFFLLLRGPEAHIDFDLELAKRHSQDNPVYYVQYAHARLASIFRKAIEKGIPFSDRPRLNLLELPEESELIQRMHQFPEEVILAMQRLEPQRLPFYLLETARVFQSYYSRAKEDPRYRVLSADVDTSQAKLYLCRALKNTLSGGLKMIGISAPEVMETPEEE